MDHPAGGKVILESFEEAGGLGVLVESLERTLATIKLFKRPQDSAAL